jgi:hypothetical protein
MPDRFFPYRTKNRAYVAGFAGLLTLVMAAGSIWLGLEWPKCKSLQAILVVGWGTWPPLWFLFEHYYWFDNWENEEAAKRYREGRELWSKLWAGVGAILAALLFTINKMP